MATNASYKIYGCCDPRGITRYVGVTSGDLSGRLRRHLAEARYSKDVNHRLNWFRSLSEPPTLYLLEEGSGDWKAAEKYWISLFRAYGHRLVNSTDGGDGVLNPSEETRKKLRAKKSSNAAGFVGIYWHKVEEKWYAYMNIGSVRIWQALFVKKEDAIFARSLAVELGAESRQMIHPGPGRKQRNNTSGSVGVAWDKCRERWKSYLKRGGKLIWQARFVKKEDAIFARALAVELYAK